MAFQIKFAGLTLNNLEDWSEDLPSRVNPETFPRRQGAIVQPVPFVAPRQIRVSGTVDKETESDLKTYFRTLGASLHNGIGELYLRDDSVFLNAVKSGYGYSYSAKEKPSTRGKYFIDFIAGDPYWYSATPSSDTQSNVSSSPHTFSVDNDGGTLTPIAFSIEALGADKTGTFKLTDTTHGLSFSWTGTIEADQLLTIDTGTKRVLNGGGNGIAGFTGSFFLLVVGTNNFSYEGPTGVDLVTTWTHRFD